MRLLLCCAAVIGTGLLLSGAVLIANTYPPTPLALGFLFLGMLLVITSFFYFQRVIEKKIVAGEKERG